MTDEVLLIPKKTDVERNSVAEFWSKNGGVVLRIEKFWERPIIDSKKRITIYAGQTHTFIFNTFNKY